MNVPSETELIILMYHHIDSVGDSSVTVSADTFESHIRTLSSNGYTTVSFEDVINYVDTGAPLPKKPVCIVFDDGYESIFTLAFPILKKYSAKAAVCIIGSSIGCDTYKDTGSHMLPHLSFEQARIMLNSGLVEIGSHTYDMHMYAPLENDDAREYAIPLPSETPDTFAAAFTADHEAMCSIFRKHFDCLPTVFAYPHGKTDITAEKLLRNFGVRVTLTTENGVNILKRGDTESLYLMYRYNVNEHSDLNAILGISSKNLGEVK